MIPAIPEGAEIVEWCSGCQQRESVGKLKVLDEGQEVELPLCATCTLEHSGIPGVEEYLNELIIIAEYEPEALFDTSEYSEVED